MSLGLWLEKWSFFGPERTALVDGDTGERWSYAEFYRRSQRRAAWLRDAHGVGPGDRVAWTEKNRLEFFEVFFACARLGAILVPVNWRLAPPEVAWIIGDCAPKVTLDDESLSPIADEGALPEVPLALVSDATPVMILYTSGTTGRPKGALLTHGSITANSVNTTVACDLRSDDSTVTYTPLFHTGAVNVLSVPLFHRGGKVVLTRGFDAAQVLRLTAEESVTILFGVPTTFEMLRDEPGFAEADLSSVRFSLCGGAPCPMQLIHDYAAKDVVFRQGYGLTEVGPNCFSLPPVDAVRKAGTVGRPVMHCEARIVDAEGADVAPGQVGELWLKGPHVCGGYWQNPEATAAALKDGWWATGDLFEVDEDGYYRVVGRKKEMFISGAENVYPAEVEQAILEHPAVKEACVVGVPDAKWGEVGCGYIAPAEVTGEELTEFLRDRLARYKVPKRWVIVEALPHTASGKVDRRGLEALGTGDEAAAGGSATRAAGTLALLLLAVLGLFAAPASAGPELGAARLLKDSDGHEDAITALSAQGDRLLSVDRFGKARLWDLSAKRLVGRLAELETGLLAAALSAERAAIGGEDGTLRVYDTTAAGGAPLVLEVEAKSEGKGIEARWSRPALTALAFSADGKQLAAGYSDGSLRTFDIKEGKELQLYEKVHERRVCAILPMPEGKSRFGEWITAGWDGVVRLIEGRKAGKSVKLSEPELTGMCYAEKGEKLIVCTHTGQIAYVELDRKLKASGASKNRQGWVACPVVAGETVAVLAPNDNAVVLFKLGGEELTRRAVATFDVKEPKVGLVMAQAKDVVVTGNSDGSLSLFKLETED